MHNGAGNGRPANSLNRSGASADLRRVLVLSQEVIVLERVEWIRGIGLLHDVDGRALKLTNTQLIYADNGRGKSTLASILRSVATGDSYALLERKTIEGTIAPDASLTFCSGHKATFTKGK